MPQRPPPLLIADSLGLDFLNSIATPVDTVVDWLEDGEGFVAWLAQAQFVSADVIEAVRKQALPGELDKVADQARKLREWFREFVNEHRGSALEARHLRALGPLNRLLERDDAFQQLVAAGKDAEAAFELRARRRWRTPDSLLLPIGERLAELVCSERFADIRACEGPTCTLLFADHTRGKARRWCSMAVCGNRAKQLAHRKRASKQKNRANAKR
jgi:predicted RNA-binding Zn ribbon-like protein